MLTWSFRYIGLSEYITKINFTYLILLFLNVTTKDCEIVYVACLCSSRCISIGKQGRNWPVTPKDIQVLLWNLWLLPHMAKGTLQMWLRIWKIILDYLELFWIICNYKGPPRRQSEIWQQKRRNSAMETEIRVIHGGSSQKLEEAKILSWALQKPCSYLDFSSVRL